MTKFYDKVAKNYHKFVSDNNNFFNKYVEEPATIKKLKEIDLNNKVVLDLGCGSGRYTKPLLSMSASVTGIDPSSKLLEIAKNEIKYVEFKIGSAEDIPCNDSTFDFVLMGMVIQYFYNPDKAFAEISRVLKKTGHVVFTGHVPYLANAKPVKVNSQKYYTFDSYFKEGKRKRKWTSLGIEMPFYHYMFETIIRSILRNGFTIIDYRDLKPLKSGKRIDVGDYNEAITKSKFYLMELRKE